MLATFVIGLREGLEAALIVSIVAAFLRRNGRPLTAMWVGVISAVLLSIAVGVGLKIVESSLPQRAQEGMETVIGGVAVVFVTGMIMWMRTNARGMKRELETAATEALSGGSARALAIMAFLAVLKEGFETAVFLLATLQSSGNVATATSGAVLGLLCAVILGAGIYRGGVRINLAKFFSFTSIFLLLVAAGLVATALGNAHEAGWLNEGQGKTFDLGWVSPDGSIRSALLTGVFGIPREPRVIQIIGWCLYMLCVGWMLYAPSQLRPSTRVRVHLLRGLAALCLLGAAGLFVGNLRADAGPSAHAAVDGGSGRLVLRGDSLTTPSGTVALKKAASAEHDGVNAQLYNGASAVAGSSLPSKITLDQLEALNGGRLPLGMNPATTNGPFTAQWGGSGGIQVWSVDGGLLDAQSAGPNALTLSGGGLATERTISVNDLGALGSAGRAASWRMAPADVKKAATTARNHDQSLSRRSTWGHKIPLLLLIAAIFFLWRSRLASHELKTADGEQPARQGKTKKDRTGGGATPAAAASETSSPQSDESATGSTSIHHTDGLSDSGAEPQEHHSKGNIINAR